MMLPHLPPEIISLVIQQSLPQCEPYDRSLFRKRNKTLCKFSLVNSSWKALALRELWKVIKLHDKNLNTLLSLMYHDDESGGILSSKVKSIDVTTSSHMSFYAGFNQLRPITAYFAAELIQAKYTPYLELDPDVMWPFSKLFHSLLLTRLMMRMLT